MHIILLGMAVSCIGVGEKGKEVEPERGDPSACGDV